MAQSKWVSIAAPWKQALCALWNLLCIKYTVSMAARGYWLFIFSCKEQRFISSIQCALFRMFFWEVISATRASYFIRGSKHLETLKALRLLYGIVLLLVSRCLEPLMKYSHSLILLLQKLLVIHQLKRNNTLSVTEISIDFSEYVCFSPI